LRDQHRNLAEVLLEMGEADEAFKTAETLAHLPGAEPEDCVKAAAILARGATPSASDREEPAERAVRLLNRAVALGLKDRSTLEGQTFNILRGRQDFKQVLAALEE
jgi:hypothetical protein